MTGQPIIDLRGHADEVRELWDAYGRGENKRVPMTFACDEQVWLKVAGKTFREFYTNPEVHFQAQLEGKKWFCENIVGDMVPGLPDRWDVGVQFWMDENEFFGCEVDYQDDDYAWARPLPLELKDLIHHVGDIDAEEQVRRGTTFKLYTALRELADGKTFDDRPINVRVPGLGTHGVFTKAAEIRGLDRICVDMYESPDLVDELLEAVMDKSLERMRACHKLAVGEDVALPNSTGSMFCDDSIQMISAGSYERFILPRHEKLYLAMTTGPRGLHLCGRASQHYEALRWKLNVTVIDGPGPFVDHAHYLQAFAPDFSFNAQVHNTVLERGSRAEIDDMLRRLLNPGANAPGRFNVLGFITRNTALENVRSCYELARAHGAIEDAAC